MVRPPLSAAERERGCRLGIALREARGGRTMTDVADASGVSVETLRKIEAGRIATPAFFTVVALADALRVPVDELVGRCAPDAPSTPDATAPGAHSPTRRTKPGGRRRSGERVPTA